jgi:hypothetical protein
MDFIEKWLGVSPDGGDGSLEMLYVVALGAAICAFIFRSRIRGLVRRIRARDRW